MPQDREDGDEDDGRTATFPFLNQLFGAAASGDAEPRRTPPPGRTRTAARGRSAP